MATEEIIYHVLFSDPSVAELYIRDGDSKFFIQIARFVQEKLRNQPEMFESLYKLNSFLKRYAKSPIDYGKDVAMNELRNSKDQVVQQIFPYIIQQKDPGKIDSITAHNIGFYLLIFLETYPGIYETLYPTLQPLIDGIGLSQLHSILGPDFLFLLHNCSSQFIKTMPIDGSTIIDLFKSPLIIKDSNLANILQTRITKQYEFPNHIPFISDISFTCTNSTITKLRSFNDLSHDLFLEYLTTFQLDLIDKNLSLFPALIPYFIVINQPIIYSDLQAYSNLLTKNYGKSPAAKLVQRLANDVKLLQMVSFLTDQDITPADLMDSSFVFHLQFTIGNTQILEFENLKFYIVSDIDSNRDFDFIRGYHSIRCLLTAFQSPPAAKKLAEQCTEHLAAIRTKSIQENLCKDLFSLLFVQKKGQFVCTTPIARTILRAINKYSNNSYMKNGLTLVGRFKLDFWQKETDFADLFKRDPGAVFAALDRKDWATADELTRQIPFYRKIYVLARSIDAMRRGAAVPDEASEYQTILKLEVGMSSPAMAELLKGLVPAFPDFARVIEARSGAGDVLSPLSSDASEPAREFADMFDGSDIDSLGHLQSLLVAAESMPRLSEFAKYSIAVAQWGSLNASGDPSEAIKAAFKSGDMESASGLALMTGKSLIETVLGSPEDFEINQQFIDKFSGEYPAAIRTLAITSNRREYAGELSVPLERYIKKEQSEKNEKSADINIFEMDDDSIDDWFFRLDHSEILKIILEKKEMTEKDWSLLSLVEYCADKEQETEIATRRTKIRASEFKQNDVEKCSVQLYEKYGREDAFRYLQSLPEDQQKSAARALAMAHPEDSGLVGDVIEINRSILIEAVRRFSTINPSLLLLCDANERKVIHAVSQLPVSISSGMKNISQESLDSILASNPSLLFKLKRTHRAILKDSVIVESLRAIPDLKLSLKAVRHIQSERLVHDETLIQKEVKRMTTLDLFIDSTEKEEEAIKTIRTAISLSLIYEENRLLPLFKAIVERRPYTVFGIPYHLDNSPQLLNVCLQFSQYDKAVEVCHLLNLDENTVWASQIYLINCLTLSEMARSVADLHRNSYFERYCPNGWTLSRSPFFDTTTPFFSPIYRVFLLPHDRLLGLEAATEGAINKKKELIVAQHSIDVMKEVRQTIIKPTNIALNTSIRHFVERHTDPVNSIGLLISFQQLGNAYQALFRLPEADMYNAFATQFFLAGQSIGNPESFESFIIQQDPNLFVTSGLWDHLVSELAEKELFESIIHICHFRNQFEDEAVALLKLFKRSDGMNCYKLTGLAYVALENSVKYRKSNEKLSPPFRPSQRTTQEVEEMLSLVSIQFAFCQWCIEHRRPIKSDYDVIFSKEGAGMIAAQLKLAGDDEFFNRVVEETGVPTRFIGNAALSLVEGVSVDNAIAQLSKLLNKDAWFVELILPRLLHSVAMGKEWMKLPVVISALCRDRRQMALYYLEYDLLGEAYMLILSEKLPDLKPLLAYRASQTNNEMILCNMLK